MISLQRLTISLALQAHLLSEQGFIVTLVRCTLVVCSYAILVCIYDCIYLVVAAKTLNRNQLSMSEIDMRSSDIMTTRWLQILCHRHFE